MELKAAWIEINLSYEVRNSSWVSAGLTRPVYYGAGKSARAGCCDISVLHGAITIINKNVFQENT